MRFIKFGCLVLLALSITGSKPSKSSSKLNVLFIVADDLNCGLGLTATRWPLRLILTN